MNPLSRSTASGPDAEMEPEITVSRTVEPREAFKSSPESTEILMILGGHATLEGDHAPFRLSVGNILVAKGNRSHFLTDPDRLEVLRLNIRESTIFQARHDLGALPGFHAVFTFESRRRHPSDARSILKADPETLERLLDQTESLEKELNRTSPASPVLARVWLFLLLGEISRIHTNSGNTVQSLDHQLGAVLSWIEWSYPQPVRLSQLTAIARMSERSFLRHFKNALGLSPMDYLNRIRIQRAAELLNPLHHDLSIAEIAQRTGFDDSNYFSRLFKRTFGVSPRAYLRSAPSPSPRETAGRDPD